MRLSRSWLTRYVDLTPKSDAEIAHALTMVGFEVEGLHASGLAPLPHVVVGEILSFEQHPNADRLSVCQVDAGEGTVRTIVCGAKNFQARDRVIVALPGAVLPGDFAIKESKLRGVTSQGMLCSERELGLGEDQGGIAILMNRPAIGTPVNEVYGARDTVFEVEVTPNRPDSLSHLGMARELAAWFKLPLRYPEIRLNLNDARPGKLVEALQVDWPEACPHYRGYAVRGVTVAPSPDWLQRALKAIGLRPINNVVDATNFVLHELGQPLHAFDVAKVAGGRIVVRAAREGEGMVTLDGKERALRPHMLVIADAEKPLVVAGVMGSVAAEVDASTRDIFLESAYFEPRQVRRTARALGLSTDSSYRFERGVDPKGAAFAALRCLDLIVELAGGELLGPALVEGEPPLVESTIDLDPAFVRERLGFDISNEDIRRHLDSLELTTDALVVEEGSRYRVSIPSWRQDLGRPIDLVEEVLRLHGTDKVPSAQVRAVGVLDEDDAVVVATRRLSAFLVGQGFAEALHYSMRAEPEVRKWFGDNQADSLRLANPLASDASHLRPSLIPGLLDSLRLNLSRGNQPRKLFETGRVFREQGGQVFEYVSIAFVLLKEGGATWRSEQQPDFFAASALMGELLRLAGIPAVADRHEALKGDGLWQSGHAAIYRPADGVEARFGLLSLVATTEWDLQSPVLAGSLVVLPSVLKERVARRRYQPLVLYPAAARDLALLVDRDVAAGHVREELHRLAQGVVGDTFAVEAVELFDLYEGQGVPEGKKSLAFTFRFRAQDRTLNDKEVNHVFEGIQKRVMGDNRYSIRAASE